MEWGPSLSSVIHASLTGALDNAWNDYDMNMIQGMVENNKQGSEPLPRVIFTHNFSKPKHSPTLISCSLRILQCIPLQLMHYCTHWLGTCVRTCAVPDRDC